MTIADLNNPHIWQIVRGADEEARASGYSLLLMITGQGLVRERDSLREVLRRRVDGLILIQNFHDQLADEYRTLAWRHSPAVLLGSYPTALPELDTVTPGHGDGAEQMMAHLLTLGHRRIGFVFGVPWKNLGGERLAVYQQMLTAAGVCPDDALVERTGPSIEDGYHAALRLLDCKPRPTAILVINDYLSIGVLHAASERGLRVPADLSVAGFDDIDIAPYLNPSLTTVGVQSEEVGRLALRLLLQRLHEPSQPAQHIHVPAQLIKRGSTGPCPGSCEEVI
jgi:LacI family transcriptional regulator